MRAVRAVLVAAILQASVAGTLAAQPAAPRLSIPLETVDPAVREQFERALRELQELEGQPGAPATSLADAYGEVGRLLHAYKLLGEAESYYRRAHELAPAEFRWSYYLAVVLQRSGPLDEAARLLERSLALEPQRHAARLRLAEIYLDQNGPVLAESLLRQSLSEHPSCARARAGLGRLALAREEFAEAAELFEAVLADYPGATHLHYPLGMAYRGLGELDTAKSHLAESSSVEIAFCDPLMSEVRTLAQGEKHFLFYGSELIRAGRREAALEAFDRALEVNPESAEARGQRAAILTRMGQHEEAKREYLEVLRRRPESTAALYGLAVTLASEGKTEEAETYLREAVAIDEQDWRLHALLGTLLLRRGAGAEALEHFGLARRLDPSHKSAWFGEAAGLIQLARYGEAISLLEQAHRLFPEDDQIRHLLARLLAACPETALRDGAQALELALPLAREHPERSFLEAVALAFAEEGRCDEARLWQEGALARAEFDGQPAMVERLRGRLKELEKGPPCRPAYATAEELFPPVAGAVPAPDLLAPEESGAADAPEANF